MISMEGVRRAVTSNIPRGLQSLCLRKTISTLTTAIRIRVPIRQITFSFLRVSFYLARDLERGVCFCHSLVNFVRFLGSLPVAERHTSTGVHRRLRLLLLLLVDSTETELL